MKIELARALKDAGFPQGWKGLKGEYVEYSPHDEESGVTQDVLLYIYVPTLSELIEACGDRFPMLSRGDNGIDWICCSYNSDKDSWEEYSKGSTPEEAVARLWLEFNK